jgi:YbbR domain-containing protein
MLLPNLTERLGIAIPQFFSSYVWLFPLMGIIIAIVFLYVSLGLAKRFQASSQTYNKIIKLLPEELQRESIKNMPIKILNHTNTYILPILMFAVLIILGVILFIASVTAPAA